MVCGLQILCEKKSKHFWPRTKKNLRNIKKKMVKIRSLINLILKINLMIKMRSRVILINFNVNLVWNIDLEANRWRWLTFIMPWENNIVDASEKATKSYLLG